MGHSTFSVPALLDRAKTGAGNVSDYRLAKLAGVTQSAISMYRNGQRLPDDAAILRLCELSGDDPAQVAAEVQAMRAGNLETAALWQQIAQRLSSPAAARFAVLLAMVFVAQFLGGAEADAMFLPLLGTINNPHIVSIGLTCAGAVLALLGWRLLRHRLTQRRAGEL